jgi:cell division protein FtsI/penicillin-binding protein 2
MDSGQHRRILVVMVLLGVLAFVPVGVRLYSLMVRDYHYYTGLARNNQSRTTPVTADRGDILDLKHGLIDFDGEQIEIFYDVTQSNTWSKDFKETRYLGGSVQGDWNKAVGMTSTVSVSAVTVMDQEKIKAMRRLASYPGVCHLRTLDGASFSCDIQISENRNYGQDTFRAEYSISATRVDPDGFDGDTYGSWSE